MGKFTFEGKSKKWRESEKLELKSSLANIGKIIETVVAFASTNGGKIFIAISNSGRVLGVNIGKDTIEKLTNKIADNTDPKIYPSISTEKVRGKSIIIIEVKESHDKPVLAYGKPFKRVGKSTMRISKAEYERMILEKHKEKLQFDKQICEGANLKDIDRNTFCSAKILKNFIQIQGLQLLSIKEYSHLFLSEKDASTKGINLSVPIFCD